MDTSMTLKSQFVQPHHIQELGEEGLTAHEIAKSLGVPAKHVLEKLRRGDWVSHNLPIFKQAVYTAKNENNRLVKTFALNKAAAKLFVARWVGTIGDSYSAFLFECELVATQLLPEVVKQLERTTKELNAVKDERFKQKRGRRPRMLHTAVFNTNSLFADFDKSIGLVELRKIPESEMTGWQKVFSRAYYCTRNYSRMKAKVDTELMPALRTTLIDVFGKPVTDNLIDLVERRKLKSSQPSTPR